MQEAVCKKNPAQTWM